MSTRRREFLKSTGAAALALTSMARGESPNNKIVVGMIGPGGMGSHHLQHLVGRKDAVVAWVCDVDGERLAKAAKTVESGTGKAPQATKDLREILDKKEVDAVFIATPDHWHAPATILACNAGKHVYVEKPCSHNLREGRLMIEAARRSKTIVQVGTQSRSTDHVRQAMELLRSNAIGDVIVAKAWNSQLRGNIGKQRPSEPPKHLDFDLWLGPAPRVPFQANMLHGVWRWWHDYGCGDIGNDGVHDIDIARWGLGVRTHPSTIAALGGKFFFDDDQQWPDTQYIVFEYAGDGKIGNRKQLIFEQRIWSPYVQEGHENGNAFYGTKGMLILGKGSGWQLYGPRNKLVEKAAGSPNLPAHHQNFFDCIRGNRTPNADIEIGHLSAALCHLGNIATRTGRVLHFDAAKEQIVGDEEANALVRRRYRPGHWAVPNEV